MALLGTFRIQPIRTGFIRRIPVEVLAFRPTMTFCACAVLLICVLLLGGGARGGYLSDAILELIAIPAFLLALASLIDSPLWQTRTKPDVFRVLAFCCVLALLPLIQLVPLPPWIWTRLPGREPMLAVFNLVGEQIPWMPISVSPHATWLSFLSLLPPIALFLLTVQLSYHERRTLSLVVVGIGVVSVFLGLSQVGQGANGVLRFFGGNDSEAVGFFANRNHFAAFVYAVLLFAAVWVIEIGFKIKSWTDLKNFEAGKVAVLVAMFLILIVIIAGEAMARSRAGLALTIAALLAIFMLSFTDRRNASGGKASKIILAAVLFGVVLSMQFAVYRILGRFATDPLENSRIVFARNTIKAASAFMPFGAGSGSFVPVYKLFEQPADTIPDTFVNRAHNDFLEIWLETGVVGPILLCLFLIWLGVTVFKVWKRPAVEMTSFDSMLARAATVIIMLLLAHSVVDYPLRTEAIMALFAVCCGLLIEPVRNAQEALKFAASLERYLVRRKATPEAETLAAAPSHASRSLEVQTPASQAVLARPSQSESRWGANIQWPEEWQGSSQQDGPDPKSDTNPTSKLDAEQ